jgi:hypothetical protein
MKHTHKSEKKENQKANIVYALPELDFACLR